MLAATECSRRFEIENAEGFELCSQASPPVQLCCSLLPFSCGSLVLVGSLYLSGGICSGQLARTSSSSKLRSKILLRSKYIQATGGVMQTLGKQRSNENAKHSN